MIFIVKTGIRKLLYVIVFIFFKTVRYLPFSCASDLGSIAGGCVYYLPLPARRIALTNLKRAFPDKAESEIKTIARNAFRNQGRNLFELFTFEKLTKTFIDEHILFEGKKSLEEAFRKGKGILYLCAHFGNWELMGAGLSLWGYPINVIARKIYINEINNMLVHLRNSAGVQVILRSEPQSAKKILRALKRNEVIGMLIDQDARVPGVMVNFFGIPACTPSGLAALAVKSSAAVVSGFLIRNKHKHRLEITGPLEVINTGNYENDILQNTQNFTNIIEKYIRMYPEQWVWMHERWKTIKN
ncbi:MAG: lysophospholipid acyltransferase family protein [bacterium]